MLVGRLHPQTWGTPEPPRAGFFAAKGLLGAALDAAARALGRSQPATEPFLHPGRSARVLAGGEDVGWIGELHPLVARAWDLDHGAALFEVDLDRVARPRRRGAALRRPHELPASCGMDLSVTLDDDVPAATVLATVREAGGELLAGVRVFDLYRGEQVGEGRKSLALALAFRAPDRTLTDEDVAPLRERIVAALRDAAGRRAACLARSSPAPRATRARWPPPCCARHPRFDLVAVTSRSDVGTRLSDLYPHHRVPLTLEEFDAERHGQADAAIVAYPHGAAAPVVAALHERGVRVVDLSADFRLRDSWTSTSSGTSRTRTPSSSARPSTGCPSCAARRSRAPTSWPTPAASRPRRCSRWRRCAPWLDDVVIDAKTGVSGAGRTPTATTHFVSADENVTPYGVAGHRHVTEIDQELAFLGAADPRDLRAAPAAARPGRARLLLLHAAHGRSTSTRSSRTPTRTSRSSSWPTGRPGVRDVRDTNFCRIHARLDERTRKVFVFAAIDNLWKGAVVAGGPEPQPDVRRRRDGRAAVSPFFSSRWVEVPEWVREDPAGGLPAGFRAAGVAAGIKPSGGTDVGLLVSDAPETTSAARFTRSGVLAAPVLVTRERSRLDALRVVVANSGNANAATGGRGHGRRGQDAGRGGDGRRGARPTRSPSPRPASSACRSTRGRWSAAWRARSSELRPDGDGDFAAAIMTTDAFEKRASLEVDLSGGTVRLCAQAKGAGMIQPAFATMLCFVQTDAALAAETADLLLGVCVKRSFDRISVDGQLSTNDTAILMCSGASGVAVEPESEDELLFGQALDALLRQLALAIVRDGEGARRIGRVVVRGGHADGVEARRARGGQLAAGQGRAARRRPQLGAHRAGGRHGAARHRAAGRRRRDRGRAGVRARRRDRLRRQGAGRRPWRATRSSTSSSCPARATRPRSSSPTSATST